MYFSKNMLLMNILAVCFHTESCSRCLYIRLTYLNTAIISDSLSVDLAVRLNNALLSGVFL